MKQLKLFMLLAGCKPAGRHTEQHDVFFTIGESISDTIPGIISFWPEANDSIHIDAWREVTAVDGYSIDIEDKKPGIMERNEKLPRLYFINLGGYKQYEFEEFHYKMIVVASEKGDAIKQSKQTAFYKHTGFHGAPSHVDDKYGIDVDDVFRVEDILSIEIKEKYIIKVSPTNAIESDEIHLGYFTPDKLESLYR
ncbi:MAG: DUF1543 domain-containing protein [Ginsengibacter sp.]